MTITRCRRAGGGARLDSGAGTQDSESARARALSFGSAAACISCLRTCQSADDGARENSWLSPN